jgi:hypothetical protein
MAGFGTKAIQPLGFIIVVLTALVIVPLIAVKLEYSKVFPQIIDYKRHLISGERYQHKQLSRTFM